MKPKTILLLILLSIFYLNLNSQNADNLLKDKNDWMYFNFEYENINDNEFKKIKEGLQKEFKYKADSTRTGYVTIRFFVDSFGQTDKFSVLEVDNNFQKKSFDKELVTELTSLVKKITGWKKLKKDEIPVKYMCFFTFKLDYGKISFILP
jgi:hypothetical protein